MLCFAFLNLLIYINYQTAPPPPVHTIPCVLSTHADILDDFMPAMDQLI